jgi:hypothetical protein
MIAYGAIAGNLAARKIEVTRCRPVIVDEVNRLLES